MAISLSTSMALSLLFFVVVSFFPLILLLLGVSSFGVSCAYISSSFGCIYTYFDGPISYFVSFPNSRVCVLRCICVWVCLLLIVAIERTLTSLRRSSTLRYHNLHTKRDFTFNHHHADGIVVYFETQRECLVDWGCTKKCAYLHDFGMIIVRVLG